jgi:hypothetical protein
MPNDSGVLQQPCDVPRAESRHGFGIEPGERGAEVLALAEDRQPGQPGLEPLEAQPFEQATLVGDGPPPLVVVIREIELVRRRPAARRLRQA